MIFDLVYVYKTLSSSNNDQNNIIYPSKKKKKIENILDILYIMQFYKSETFYINFYWLYDILKHYSIKIKSNHVIRLLKYYLSITLKNIINGTINSYYSKILSSLRLILLCFNLTICFELSQNV